MKFQIVTGHYMDNKNIRLYLRDEEGTRTFVDISGFEPYAGYLSSDNIPKSPMIVRLEKGLEGINGEQLTKIVFQTPNDVPKFREQFHQRWEDDVRFVKRMQIDTGLTSGIELDRPEGVVHYTDIQPCDFSFPPLKVGWDIECYSNERVPNPEDPDQPITAVTFWNEQTGLFDSILFDDECKITKPEPNWAIYHVDTEDKLLGLAIRYLDKIQPDILFEWGSLDKDYFPPRAKLLGIDTSIFRHFCTFDMIEAYKKIYKRGSNRLKDVAFDEKIIDYLPPEVNFAYLYDHDRMALVLKNKHDVEWMVKLNALKGDLARFFWNLKNYSGLEDIQEAVHHGALVDTGLLRKYHGHYMLPSKPSPEEAEERKKLLGAVVRSPPIGLFSCVGVVDFSRYYQNLLIGILSKTKLPRVMPLVDLAQDILNVRDAYDQKLKNTPKDTPEYHSFKGVRDSVKYVGEAIIGYLGGKHSRWYDPEIFEAVIKAGRDGILHAEELCTKRGYKVYYYDTDGLDVQLHPSDDPKKLIEDAKGLAEELNGEMSQWAAEHQIDRKLRLKIDMVFNRVLYSGKKKRKAGHVIWDDGEFCDFLLVKGFEYIRRDSSTVTRAIQREVFEHLLRKGMEGLRVYLVDVISRMKAGKIPLSEAALSKGIKGNWEDYQGKKSLPQHIRGSLWANKYLNAGIRPHDQVKMVYVKRTPGYPATNVVCFLDEDIVPKSFVIDWDKMIQRTIEQKVGQYIGEGGLSWAEVMGMKKLSGVFE